MQKEKTDKIMMYGLLVEFLFVVVLIINFYVFILSSSSFARTAIIIELILIIIAKNYLKNKLIKRIIESK